MTWRTASLAELCEIDVGRTPARANPAFWGDGEPWLSIADMNQGRVITRTKEQITSLAAKAGRRVRPGTVLLSFKLSIGKVALAGIPLYTNEAIAALPIKDIDRVDPAFLMRALEATNLAGSSNRAAMGQTLNKSKLAEIAVSFPGIHEQRRIASILDRSEAIIGRRHAVLRRLGELDAQMFSAMARTVDRYATLRDLGVDFVSGKNVVGDSFDSHPTRRVIKVSAVSSGVFRPDESKPLPIDYQPPSAHRINKGDILFGRASGSLDLLGATASVDVEPDELYLPDKVWRLRVAEKSPVSERYVLGVLRSRPALGFIRHNASGAAGVRNIAKSRLLDYLAPCPSSEDQQHYMSRVQAVEERRATVSRALTMDRELFASLQFRAFRGEL